MKLHYGDLTDSTNLVKIISEVSFFKIKHTSTQKLIFVINVDGEGKLYFMHLYLLLCNLEHQCLYLHLIATLVIHSISSSKFVLMFIIQSL